MLLLPLMLHQVLRLKNQWNKYLEPDVKNLCE
jgi:hypothetical protein